MRLFSHLLFLSFSLQVLAFQSVGRNDAWVRKYPCGPLRPDFPSLESTPFWIDSIRGTWETREHTSKLRLGILAVHNRTLFDCDHVDIDLLKSSLEFDLMGHSVGHLEDLRHECPLPITDALTPLGSNLFSSFQLVYTFPSAHRLQTVVSTIRFHRPDGPELDCSVVKITPDLGSSISAAFTYTPLGVLFLVMLSSWRTHLNDTSSVLSYDSAFAGQEPLWAMILDIAGYLRYLQFIFVSALMSVEYPGFYVPAVGKLSWSSLLFWRGPFDNGFSHQGINGGMYVSNSSYGMQFMPQMLGYPNALNTLNNSAINLVILITPLFLALVLLLFRLRQPSQLEKSSCRWTLTKAATLSGGMALCFFSVPLLAYMAYELFLAGYLPNYRIALAMAMLLVLTGAQYFLTLKTDRRIRLELQSRDANTIGHLRRIWRLTAPHIPHLMPLLQAICVGSLQGFPWAQISILSVSELAVFLHTIFSRSFASRTTFYSAVRMVSSLMSTMFMSPPNEATRQGVGYAMLALHGAVVVLVFPIQSIRQLYQSIGEGDEISQREVRSASDETSIRISPLSRQHRPDFGPSHKQNNRELPWHSREQDTSSFYRTPRLRSSTHVVQTPPTTPSSQPSSSSDQIIELAPIASANERPFDLKLALSEVPERGGVDYSVREVDRYYGIASSTSELRTDSAHSNSEPDHASNVGILNKFKTTCQEAFNSNLKLFQGKQPEEKGFSVVRPNRPLQDLGAGEGPSSQQI